MGTFASGKNSFELNVSDLSAGNYNVSLVVDGASMFTKTLSVTK
jgi:YbbR domain-containing protein